MVQPIVRPNSRLYTTATTLPRSTSISRHISTERPIVISVVSRRDCVIFVGLCSRQFDFPKIWLLSRSSLSESITTFSSLCGRELRIPSSYTNEQPTTVNHNYSSKCNLITLKTYLQSTDFPQIMCARRCSRNPNFETKSAHTTTRRTAKKPSNGGETQGETRETRFRRFHPLHGSHKTGSWSPGGEDDAWGAGVQMDLNEG
ncbi:hypothetical protein Syun_009697 [Stephania yunnanensis]|uniref:Uncharacterized protein n=1 Tax=Stephania yunnanensis TaxID=152371 RepID=A0AAP0PNU1_9MAGN